MRRGPTRNQFHDRLLAHNRLRAIAGFRRLKFHRSPRVPGLKRNRQFNQLRGLRTDQSLNQVKADRLKAVP